MSDDWLSRISATLEVAELPGQFFACVSRTRFPQPGIVVQGHGNVPLPVADLTASTLTARCMLVDPRNLVAMPTVWSLPASHVELRNPAWRVFVEETVGELQLRLGFPAATKMVVRLRCLVLYEQGGARAMERSRSRDRAGVVGSLLIQLPGEWSGGTVTIGEPSLPNDGGAVKCWNIDAQDQCKLHCGAFYGDCAYAVAQVSDGFCLHLCYDLLVTNGEIPRFGANRRSFARLQEALTGFFALKQARDYRQLLVYALDPSIELPTRFEALSGESARVADFLSAFCDESSGRLRLFMATLDSSIDVFAGTTDQSLKGPWVPRQPDLLAEWLDASSSTLLLPTEFLPRQFPLDCDRDDGDLGEPYGLIFPCMQSAALAVIRSEQIYMARFESSSNEAVQLWARLTAWDPKEATIAAATFARSGIEWVFELGEVGDAVVTGLKRLNSLDVIRDMLSACGTFEFQPKLQEALAPFDWDSVASTVATVSKAWGKTTDVSRTSDREKQRQSNRVGSPRPGGPNCYRECS